MIESFDDLEIPEDATYEDAKTILEDKLHIKFTDLIEQLNDSLKERAKDIAGNFLVLTPFGDWSKILEEQPKIVNFLKTKAALPENWHATYIGTSRDAKLPNMVEILFQNDAVDEGDVLMGYVFLSYAGKVLHLFVRGEP
jgi:hypothetical protein